MDMGPWTSLSHKKVLLIGASGWFGSWFIEAFKHAGLPLTILKRGEDTRGEFDYIIHTAPAMTKDILEIGRKILYLSSGAIYDRDDDYAGMKRDSEALIKNHRTKTVIARCFTFVGPGQKLDAHWAVGNFLADAKAGRDIIVKGDGSAVRSYLHMADAIYWLLEILVRGTPWKAYDVGSNHSVTIADLAGRIAKLAGVGVRIQGRPSGPDYYLPHNVRAFAELGLEPAISLDDALARTYAWL